ncbi:MAG: hypothetical protein M1827_006832 [Pycnora praestabilis]|nr:MAG: hypothetical protein M1827_006832 [Pycnora praestabilis]
MSKRPFKSQATSSRAVFGNTPSAGFGASGSSSAFGATSSPLSYVSEPPDLTAISDPNIVVSFKNLSKKDSVTKAKALEEVINYVLAQGTERGGVEDALLEAWVKLYPRSSIDSSRRVRQLSHTIQGQISVTCGKRIAKYMPRLIGAWLAGLYDNDKTVSRAAQDSFKQVFISSDKMRSVWKAYERPILEYARDAIFRETVQSLNDERTVSPDDAEAKYARVIATGILVILNLLTEFATASLSTQQELYEEVLHDEQLWQFASHKDAFIRRSLYRLLRTVVEQRKDDISLNLVPVSTQLLSKALNIDQTGSIYDYTVALVDLTASFPTVWTEAYTSKKSSFTRLQQFLKKGSQGGPLEFWINITTLFNHLPQEILPTDYAGAEAFLDTIVDGIHNKDEPRPNLPSAWDFYFTVFMQISTTLKDPHQQTLLKHSLLPIFEQYIRSSPQSSRWNTGSQPQLICAQAFLKASKNHVNHQILREEWRRLSDLLKEGMKTSLPEQAKDFDKSQTQVAAESFRLYSLEAEILQSKSVSFPYELFSETSNSIFRNAIETLKSRNGKPYGSAASIASALDLVPGLILENEAATNVLSAFLTDDLPSMILSPSSSRLVSVLSAYKDNKLFGTVWSGAIEALLDAPDTPTKLSVLQSLISLPKTNQNIDIAVQSDLEGFVMRTYHNAIDGVVELWPFVNEVLRSGRGLLSSVTADTILADLTNGLTINERVPASLQGLHLLARGNKDLVKTFIPSSEGSKLLPNLLFLSESSDEQLSLRASSVSTSIESIISDESHGNLARDTMLSLVNKGLIEAGPTSLSVETLLGQARKLIEQASEEGRAGVLDQLLPDFTQWASAMHLFLQVPPNPSLAISSPLGGAVNMVERKPEVKDNPTASEAPRDCDGYSPAIRMSWFTAKLLQSSDIFNLVTHKKRIDVYHGLSLMIQLASDNLSLAGTNNLWAQYTPEIESEMLDMVSAAQGLVASWLKNATDWWDEDDTTSAAGFVQQVQHAFLSDSKGLSAEAYYKGSGFSVVNSELVELYGWHPRRSSSLEEKLRGLRKTQDIFYATALLIGYKVPMTSHKDALRLCNELIADLTGFDLDKNAHEGLRELILLNAIIKTPDNIAASVPQQRLVFLIKKLTFWLSQSPAESQLVAEVLKVLTVILPLIRQVYGSHWSETLNFISHMWLDDCTMRDEQLPKIHASLKLYAVLNELLSEESNDDLEDAWKESTGLMAEGMIALLKQPQSVPDDLHQPLRMVNELLSRQLSKISIERLEEPKALYPLLYVESLLVQQTAFGILHRQIPAAQEQISFDAALSKQNARLPDELLSLILEAPTLESLADSTFERAMPLPLRGYLMSWLLVFDHFTGSSYKVKSDYIDSIKDGAFLPGLMNFAFDFLGHARGKPVNASDFHISSYTPDMEESPKKDTQWLLIHIYYSSLKHISSLTKAWWIDCKGSQKGPVETWTEKYISPLVIADELTTVSDWVETQSGDDQLSIKVSKKAKEVTAGYEVDEQVMMIKIRLPGTYPLHQVVVEGVNRVGVDEKKWQSWLINTQGVITFSNGNLVDGLLTFRRNVTGALKGQTECAICYSIISGDKQLPSKRCGTCKNLFHSSCLFKWFKSSNSSSCPLCRNAFNYA